MSTELDLVEEVSSRPWEELSRLLKEGRDEEIQPYLEQLPVGDLPLTVSRLDEEECKQLLERLTPEQAAGVLDELPYVQATDALESIEPAAAAAILGELPSDEQADLIGDLDEEDAKAILDELSAEEADRLRVLAEYEDEEAGGLMITEYLAFSGSSSAHEVIENIRAHVDDYAGYSSQYLYVLDEEGCLNGVLRLRDLLLARKGTRIERIMIPGPHTINHHASLQTLDDFFSHYSFLAVPVVDEDDRLIGVVTRADFSEAWSDHADDDYRKSQGLVEEELRSMPLWRRVKGRLSWLSVNIGLNVLAAGVIAMHTDTLSAVIALAVFLPIISDMSGCSGNQAVAVSMRELSLGVVRPTELLWVWGRELAVGLINGLVLGLLIGSVAWLWKGNAWLGLVVGGAMALNTIVAVSIGGTIPLLLKKLNKDPALASGPILTTVTDMCGFFLVLSFANLLLDKLR